MDCIIRNATVVTAGAVSPNTDIGIDGGRIVQLGGPMQADREIDAAGRYVLPGGIDVHTHLDLPAGEATSADDFETGTRAAAFGGTTTVVDFATPEPGQSLLAALDTWRRKAEGKEFVVFGPMSDELQSRITQSAADGKIPDVKFQRRERDGFPGFSVQGHRHGLECVRPVKGRSRTGE